MNEDIFERYRDLEENTRQMAADWMELEEEVEESLEGGRLASARRPFY